MTEFRTQPNPDQPDRCPSIDPYDELQCGRRIHDDDQCVYGGIAWKRGTPRHVSDRERADVLQSELDLAHRTIDRMLVGQVALARVLDLPLPDDDSLWPDYLADGLVETAIARMKALADERAKVAQHESTIRALTTRVNVAEPKLDAWRSWGRQRGYGLTPEKALADPEPSTAARVEAALGELAELADLRAEVERLRAVVVSMLASFVHPTHPGRECLQSGHVPVEKVREWAAVLARSSAATEGGA
jgi:hypothetical protein